MVCQIHNVHIRITMHVAGLRQLQCLSVYQGHGSKATLPVLLQIIDRLCASAHYRQAVSCENSGASMAASPSSDCLLRVAMSHQKVVHLPAFPQQAAAPAAAGRIPNFLHDMLIC